MKLLELFSQDWKPLFLNFAKEELELSSLPRIKFIADNGMITAGGKNSFGLFDGNQIQIIEKDRHPVDVMRTLAHELVHHKQRLEHYEMNGEDGSEVENGANSIAGIIMRRFGEQHPEFFDNSEELNEDWKKAAKGAVAAATLATAAYNPLGISHPPKNHRIPTTAQEIKKSLFNPEVVEKFRNILNKPAVKSLEAEAKRNGIKGEELVQFLAQCAHETLNFSTLVERGSRHFFNRYDPRYSPETAKILGNTHPGDGYRYRGRGDIQLTGRANYKIAGKALGLPLEQEPWLAARPDIAAKIAVWFWNHRVASHTNDFTDTSAVTRFINPALDGLKDRKTKFELFSEILDPKNDS